MALSKKALWQRFQKRYLQFPQLGLAMDTSRVDFTDKELAGMKALIQRAFDEMKELEAGHKANPDEKDDQGQPGRMVGHYWLRDSARLNRAHHLEPTLRRQLRQDIDATRAKVEAFARLVQGGRKRGASGPFKHLLVIGIGGSALGPQFVAHALGQPKQDNLQPHFFDNTDPDGMDKVLATLDGKLGQTLVIVISKSGETKETRNGMLEAQAAYQRAGLKFADHAVAITQVDSKLDKLAQAQKWIERFPMWDWVGGRTSETSAVGLLPAALQGLDIDELLAGAAACDAVTRVPDVARNPAMQLALMWHFLGHGQGAKDMVVIPYKDRLELFSRYLQQLVMESLGKKEDRHGRTVHQGLAVYGNKGSTDQHAYIQQLRDGVHNFFVVFIEVLRDRNGPSLSVEPEVTSGDYLNGFFLGTREALYESGRQSVTLTVADVSPKTVGVLIALFERAVGFYASLVNINAYHQPGVQAGKLAADKVIALQTRLLDYLAGYASAKRGRRATAEQIARDLGQPEDAETIFKICSHLAANPSRAVNRSGGPSPARVIFEIK